MKKIEIYYNLYVGEYMKKRQASVIRKLIQGKSQPGVYLITLSQGEQNQLEFFSSLLIKQHVFDNSSLFVAGLASDYEEALEVVEQITQDVLRANGDTDIRNYLLETQRKYKEGNEEA